MSRFLPAALLVLLTSTVFASTDLPAAIDTNTTLTASASPYYLRSDVSIPAGVTVTLQPGVAIIAAGDYRLFVNGSLKGGGTAATAVVLGGKTPSARGTWQGVYVGRSGCCELTGATIRNAVTNLMCAGGTVALTSSTLTLASQEGLLAWNAASVRLASCRLASNTRYGLRLEGDQVTGLVTNCNFQSNGSYPVRLKANLVDRLGTGNFYTKNRYQRIAVSCSLSEDITDVDAWVRQAVPFELGAEESGQALTIKKGGRLIVPAGTTVCCDRLDCYGELRVLGTPSAPCNLLQRAGGRGGWLGLTLYPGSLGVLNNATIRGATTGVTADGASLQMSDCVVINCLDDGLRLTGTTSLSLQRNTFTGNGRNGLRLEGQALTGTVATCRFLANRSHPVWSLARNVRLLGGDNAYRNNAPQRVAVDCGGNPDLPGGTHTWMRQGIPLDLTVNPAGTVLNIAAGATLNVAAGQTICSGGVQDKGTLNVNGTANQPVVFHATPGLQTPGAWDGLQFIGGGGRLSGALVEWATTGLNLQSASPTVLDCRFRACRYDGLVCAGTSAPVVTGSEITANARYGVYLTGSARPNLGDLSTPTTSDDGGNTISDNGGYDVYQGGTETIRAQNNTWSSTSVAVIAQRIFDRADEATRGAVIVTPIHAPSAVAGASLAPPHSLVAQAARGGSVAFSWTQANPSYATVRVVTIAGRTMALACRGQETAAGTVRLCWSRGGEHGVRVPPGTYLALLELRQQDGTVHRLGTRFELR